MEQKFLQLVTFMLPLRMKCDKLLKLLNNAGWKEIRQKGSHKILRKDDSPETIVFPYHRGKEVPKGTVNRIIKQAGLK
jgi:predicted RNA binding protein YcfA (HicA-like mRNA interferase family)